MKTALALAFLLSALPASSTAAETEFGLKEKVTVDVQDAKISDLVTTLGAMANLPVSIDPDVSGTITIKLENVPFEKVLIILGARTGLSVRIENGKLVASRSAETLFATATLPEAYRSAPRILLADYERARSATEPVFAVVRVGDQELCYKLPFPSGETPTYSLRIGLGGDAPRAFLTQFAYEPVYKARYFVLEYGERTSSLLFGSGKAQSLEYPDLPGGFKFRISEEPREGCLEPDAARPGGSGSAMAEFEVRAVGRGGDPEVVMAPHVGVAFGQVFGLRSEAQDERTGQHRRTLISGYVTRDGRSVAAVLHAAAIWIDPQDQREYYFVQPDWPSIRVDLFPLRGDRTLIGTLPAGVATPKPLELWSVGAGGPPPSPRPAETTVRP